MIAPPVPHSVAKAPAHLWIVGALGVIFSALGCYDYLMTNMRIESYIARYAPDMIDYLDAFPAWLVIGWAIEMGSALLGSLLLLTRRSWAIYAFCLSVFYLAVSQAYQLAIGLPPSMTTPGYWSQVAVIWFLSLGLLAYAVRMRCRGILV